MIKPGPKEDLIFISILSLIVLLPYLILIDLTKNLILGSINGDVANFLVHMRSYELSLIYKGMLPLWNPYIFSGIPRLADSQLFYPFNLIHLFLPLPLALNFLFILHQFLAGIFMYLYLKRIIQDSFSSFVGAIIFALSSAFMPRIFAGNINYIFATPWIPLLFLLIARSLDEKNNIFIILAGFILSLQIFGGHIQFVFMTLVALFMYIASNSRKYISRPLYIFSGLLVFAIGISAIQILPSLELMRTGLRIKSPIFNYGFSMPVENIITLLAPGFFGWIKNGLYWGKWYPWEVSNYVGILPLFLAFFAVLKKDKYSRFFLILLLVSLVLSIGAYLPIYKYLFKYLLGFNLFRANGRFFTLGIFALSALAALGCKELIHNNDKEASKKLIFTIIFGVILISILLAFKFMLLYIPSWADRFLSSIVSYDKLSTQSGFNFGYLFKPLLRQKVANSSLNVPIVLLSLSIILFILHIRHLFSKALKKILIVLLIVVDLWGFGINYFALFSLKDCSLDSKLATFLKENIGQNRYLSLGISIQKNIGIKDKIPSIGGYSVIVPRRYNEFINFTQGLPLESPFLIDHITRPSRLFELLNLKYILTNKYLKSGFSTFKQAYSDENLVIYENPSSLPKAFIVHKAKFIPERGNILKTLSEKSFNFKDTVILEASSIPVSKESLISEIEPEPIITTYLPNRVVVKAAVLASGYLVLCDNYYPGWRAYVDGKMTPIFKADYILRAVSLLPGSHTIEFIYSPTSLKIGLFITLSFLIFVVIAFIKYIAKQRS